MKFSTARTINFCAFLLSAFLTLVSFYFQFVKGMEPCLLCVLQRWAMGVLTVLFLLAFLQNPKKTGVTIYAVITLIFSIFGIIVAGRQTWIQHQPPNLNETCLPGFSFLIHTRPLPEVIKLMFHGGSDCAEIPWRFFDLSMAEWTLVFFGILAVLSVMLFFSKSNSNVSPG